MVSFGRMFSQSEASDGKVSSTKWWLRFHVVGILLVDSTEREDPIAEPSKTVKYERWLFDLIN